MQAMGCEEGVFLVQQLAHEVASLVHGIQFVLSSPSVMRSWCRKISVGSCLVKTPLIHSSLQLHFFLEVRHMSHGSESGSGLIRFISAQEK